METFSCPLASSKVDQHGSASTTSVVVKGGHMLYEKDSLDCSDFIIFFGIECL
jgi:hypothetical protein